METEKVWYKSKTMLVSVVVGVLGGLAAAWPNANFALKWINDNGAIIGMAWGVIGMGLRFITKDKIVLTE